MSEHRILIVCLGNICRSPMGEAVLRHVAKERNVELAQVDSCGTAGYHVGEEPDERTVATCRKHNIPIKHEARQLQESDFTTFTHILASDANNLKNALSIKPANCTAVVRLWGSYLDNEPIPDPYYGRTDGFEKCYEQCVRLSNAFLDHITPGANL